jgi:hypothetical protein
MGIQTGNKRGVQSSSRKAATSRHGTEPQPHSRSVAGAFGREGADRQTPRSARPLRPRSPSTAPRRGSSTGPVGISNLPPDGERHEQRRLPPRSRRRR